MSSKPINWTSPLSQLTKGKKSKTLEKLVKGGFHNIQDLLWILPLSIQKIPLTQTFENICDGEFFKGVGKVLAVREQINFRSKGKGGTSLFNVTLTTQDRFSQQVVSLKWFNLYPSQLNALKDSKLIYFAGVASYFRDQIQIITPEITKIEPSLFERSLEQWNQKETESLKANYPTIDGISPPHLKNLLEKIPLEMWRLIPDPLPEETRDARELIDLTSAFNILHGKVSPHDYHQKNIDKAKKRIIYDEFFQEQIKIQLRKQRNEKLSGIEIPDTRWKEFRSIFPYSLTDDQVQSIEDIVLDLSNSYPMTRLIQGDVGSGKTSVALIASLIFLKNQYQVALLCPTESLALQHYLTILELLSNFQLSNQKDQISIDLLTGGQTKKEKEIINSKLKSGETSIIIGTHALIQDNIEFQNLGLAIIDEQHKFGVEQRIKLLQKGEGTHCLLLTATPIPRSLSLTQYGDLEISIIKSMPSNRKGTKTRIVTASTYQKYLSFVKTRLSMKEQVYVVVPAIEDNPEQDILNLEVVLKKYCEYFPEYRVKGLHGRMKSNEKNDALLKFRDHEIDLLVSTSVIEVGINNPNATIMTIHGPERFGLSSLHQMRGRIGRGEKPGFCFLVNDKNISTQSLERLRVIENSTDGFKIAEEDLRIRGEGDLFGKEQSGVKTSRFLASIIDHEDILELAKEDLSSIISNKPHIFEKYVKNIGQNEYLYKTI